MSSGIEISEMIRGILDERGQLIDQWRQDAAQCLRQHDVAQGGCARQPEAGGGFPLASTYRLHPGAHDLDNGTGAIRGVYLQGNEAVAPLFESWMKPFHNLGMETLSIRNTGGTDHLAFDAVGLPGFQFIQDPIEYGSRSHHSNMDTFERIQPGNMQKNAVIIAAFAYHAATRDEALPRKPLPKPRPSGRPF